MSRFYVNKESIKGSRILISGTEAHHILDVMRLKVSDTVTVFDGTGKEYTGIVTEADKKSLCVTIISTRRSETKDNCRITLIQAIPKKDKMDYIVEKATELGAVRIIPVITGRTIPSWGGPKRESAVQRWQKISLSAAKQCGRADLPAMDDIVDMEEAVARAGGHDLKLIAALSDNAVGLKDAIKGFRAGSMAIAIGPEGDFTPDEIALCEKNGFKVVSLGSRVLKSDTAGLAALAAINYEFNDR